MERLNDESLVLRPSESAISEVVARIAELDVKFVIAQFVDIHGKPRAKAVPAAHAREIFADGAAFAGFAVDGMGLAPQSPDLMAIGDPASFKVMAWNPGFARVACTCHINGSPHPLDTRVIAARAVARLEAHTGLQLMTGLEPEFFLLQRQAGGQVTVADESDSLDRPCYDYHALSRSSPVIADLHDMLAAAGLDVYQIDHEDANGQFELNFRYADALTTADNLVFFKVAARDVARKHGLVCSFMPKPFTNKTGSGLHMHISLQDASGNRFQDDTDPQGMALSSLAYRFMAGVLDHARAITALGCPTVNSYKRLVSGGTTSGSTWAPTSIGFGDNNRTAMIRVPRGRIELRSSDSSCNPYLLTAAVAVAGLDGISRELEAGAPADFNMHALSRAERDSQGIGDLPGSLPEALEALLADRTMVDGLGTDFVSEFVRIKSEESNDYLRDISQWEMARYLEWS